MKQIIIICAFFAVILLAIVGSMYIFEMMSMESAISNLLKFGAAILLLGVCSAIGVLLMGSKKESQD